MNSSTGALQNLAVRLFFVKIPPLLGAEQRDWGAVVRVGATLAVVPDPRHACRGGLQQGQPLRGDSRVECRMLKRPQDNQTEGRRQAHRPTMTAAPRFHCHEKDARRDTPPGVSGPHLYALPGGSLLGAAAPGERQKQRQPFKADPSAYGLYCRDTRPRVSANFPARTRTPREGCPYIVEKSFLVNHPSHQPPSFPDVCKYALAFSTKHPNCTCVFIRSSPVKPQFS